MAAADAAANFRAIFSWVWGGGRRLPDLSSCQARSKRAPIHQAAKIWSHVSYKVTRATFRGTYHSARDKENDRAHEGHHEIDIGLVLGIDLALLGLLRGKLASNTALGIGGILGREDGLDELLDLQGTINNMHIMVNDGDLTRPHSMLIFRKFGSFAVFFLWTLRAKVRKVWHRVCRFCVDCTISSHASPLVILTLRSKTS